MILILKENLIFKSICTFQTMTHLTPINCTNTKQRKFEKKTLKLNNEQVYKRGL